MKTNILGTEYKIIKQSATENKNLLTCGGYCDWTTCELYIRDYGIDTKDFDYGNAQRHMRNTIRHEVIHAFLHESGLWVNSDIIEEGWATNEEMVDWIAIQFPKILKCFTELEVLD